MDKVIQLLDSTTFAKKRFTRKQLVDIQSTVNQFPNLSRRELALSICEHLNWLTDSGQYKIQTCLNALEQMERAKLFQLPKKIEQSTPRRQKQITWTKQTEPAKLIDVELKQFGSITLEKASNKEDITLWNEYVDRYHYLGYRRPIGGHLRYFIVGQTLKGDIHRLGCLLFAFATPNLACRDQWIDWDKKAQQKRLHFIINNTRFLIFPWIKIKNLASKTLSLAHQCIANDWQQLHGFKPLLLETFVDPDKYEGTCYKAANWHYVGKSAGRSGSKKCMEVTQKSVYIYPLDKDYKSKLIQGKTPQPKPKKTHTKTKSNLTAKDPLVILWQSVLQVAFEVASEYDQKWQIRSRLINTMLLILFIFRLVFSKNKQGYGVTSVELWEQCKVMGIERPQDKPISAPAFSKARQKLDATIFKELNTKIIRRYESRNEHPLWHGQRVFAVDGSKINVPRQLTDNPYKKPSDNAYYPQGLISTLYDLKSKIPYDFELSSDYNERTLALKHLKALQPNDVVVYDRGYFSYAMLYYHYQANIDAVFRLPKNSFTQIQDFFDSNQIDTNITLNPDTSRQNKIRDSYPSICFKPLSLRLVKYDYDNTTYVLGTTVQDKEVTIESLSNLYHARWGVEELYKVSKTLIDVGDFHAQSDQGVKQELYAHFVLLTINRIFSNHTEQVINENSNKNNSRVQQVNTKNALMVIARNLEGLFLKQIEWVTQGINNMIDAMKFCTQKTRPGRKYERKSMKPSNKWHAATPTKQKTCV